MNKIARKIINDFNIKKEAEELGVTVWRTPSVLFVLMGMVIIFAMTSVFYISRNQITTEILILSEALVIAVIFTIGGFIIKSVEEVARANKMKSEFISIASHQMRTPLTEVNWETEHFLSEYKDKLDENQVKTIKAIIQSNAKLSNLVNDLLDVVRIEQGKLVLAEDKVSIAEVINEVIDSKKDLAKTSNINMEVAMPDSLPEIITDRRRIGAVINGIVTNAIAYTKDGGNVKLSVENDGKNITVHIEDDGIGIPKSQQDIIFEKFFRSGNASRYQTEGNGLGLFVAKNIVEKAGGKIWFKSTEGEGSVFSFLVPINK